MTLVLNQNSVGDGKVCFCGGRYWFPVAIGER